MKRKILSILVAMIMCVTGVFVTSREVRAEDTVDVDVPLESIMTEDALIGYSESSTWGVYYLSGHSVINDAGSSKIGWGGVTYAAVECKVSVNAIVERLEDGSWYRVTSASNTRTSALTAAVSKTTLVASGYSYRVRCYHYAATDVSDSCTSALRM